MCHGCDMGKTETHWFGPGICKHKKHKDNCEECHPNLKEIHKLEELW